MDALTGGPKRRMVREIAVEERVARFKSYQFVPDRPLGASLAQYFKLWRLARPRVTGVEAISSPTTTHFPYPWRPWATRLKREYTVRDPVTHAEFVDFPQIVARLLTHWVVDGDAPSHFANGAQLFPASEPEPQAEQWSPIREKTRTTRIVVQMPPPVFPTRRRSRLTLGEGSSGIRTDEFEVVPTSPPLARQRIVEEPPSSGRERLAKADPGQPFGLPFSPLVKDEGDDDDFELTHMISAHGHTPSALIYIEEDDDVEEEEDPDEDIGEGSQDFTSY